MLVPGTQGADGFTPPTCRWVRVLSCVRELTLRPMIKPHIVRRQRLYLHEQTRAAGRHWPPKRPRRGLEGVCAPEPGRRRRSQVHAPVLAAAGPPHGSRHAGTHTIHTCICSWVMMMCIVASACAAVVSVRTSPCRDTTCETRMPCTRDGRARRSRCFCLDDGNNAVIHPPARPVLFFFSC